VSGDFYMLSWPLTLLFAGLAVLGIFFTYFVCATILRMEAVLPRWAQQHGLRIVRREPRTFFQGPFFVNRYAPVYRITVEDQEKRQKRGWIRLGLWYIVGFRERIEVRWDE
jgi:hypothetical protein